MSLDASRTQAGRPDSRGRFLFRQEQGRIDAATWRLHAGWLAALVVAMTIGWLLLRPYAHVDLTTGFRWLTVAAFTYLIVYAFALILVAICYTMLTIKRLRDRRRPTGLAGLLPFLVLCAASAHFLRDQTPDVVLLAYVIAIDVVVVIAAALSVVELGFGESRDA